MSTDEIGVALVGTGFVANAHARALKEVARRALARVRVVSVTSPAVPSMAATWGGHRRHTQDLALVAKR